MERADDDGDDYIFGLPGNAALDALVGRPPDNLRSHHAKSSAAKLRTYASFTYQAGMEAAAQSGHAAGVFAAAGREERPACARSSTSATSSPRLRGAAQHLYE